MTAAFTSPTGRYVHWAEIIRQAKRQPDQWFLALPDVPVSRLHSLRKRRARDLRQDFGRLKAEPRNTYQDALGDWRCDIYCRWITVQQED